MTKNGQQKFAVTPASEWSKARKEGVLVQFPESGMIAKVRPVNTDTFIRIGKVPDALTMTVSTLTSGTSDNTKLTGDDYLKLLDMYNGFVETCFVEPKVVGVGIEPKEGEISVDDVSDSDKQFLFQFMGRPASLLESFRPGQEQPVDDLVSGESNSASA